jgi:two-component system response regulator HydG
MGPAALPVAPERGAATIIAHGRRMRQALETARRVAASSATVLVRGESGTGKELLAALIHEQSPRALAPFLVVNCAAIPEPLLESELFGHEKGAFPGAVRQRAGRFERASAGTLFLDEIGDMGMGVQGRILRALEAGEIERVGGDRPVPVDVRLIAATQRDLEAQMRAGQFREDLYYRLAVVVIALPPLRERIDEVALLAQHFLEHSARRHGRPPPRLTDEALAFMRAYGWPGNVRELRNVVERAVVLANGPKILPVHLPAHVTASPARHRPPPETARVMTLRELESRHIASVLALTGGNRVRAAELLGIHRNTLRRRMREYGITGSAQRA